jgi:hypothetical protein
MNDLRLEQAEKQLREEMKSQGYGWINGRYNKPPAELGFEKRQKELSCISMINSIVAYHWFGQSAEEIVQMEENSKYNYLADYIDVLGRDRVVELTQGQIDDIERIARCTFTDGEGISYNAIIWKEETV